MSNSFPIPDLIAKKRDGDELSESEIHHFIKCATSNSASESQIGAMLMAIYLKGMNRDETVHLTKAMMSTGSILSWPEEWQGSVADKHSTGGVGDKVSLVLFRSVVVVRRCCIVRRIGKTTNLLVYVCIFLCRHCTTTT